MACQGERERRRWKHPRKPPRSISAVSVAIVLGARASRAHGEGPQLVGSLGATLLEVKAWESSPMPAEREKGGKSNRRQPCAVKAAGTVTTGGMERRVAGYRALSLPTPDGTVRGRSGLTWSSPTPRRLLLG